MYALNRKVSVRVRSWSNRLGSKSIMRFCVLSLTFALMVPLLLASSAYAESTAYVTVDSQTVVTKNQFSLGFMLDGAWKTWCDSADQRQLAKDANFKIVRFFDRRIQPCTYWNESTKTGTFNWANVDLIVSSIFEIGAEPLICLGGCKSTGQTGLPRGMVINPTTKLAYSASWAAYCAAWVKHFKATGAPVRFYEIINEPQAYLTSGGWTNTNWTRLGYFANFFNASRTSMRVQNSAVMVSFDFITYKAVLDYWLNNGYSVDTLNFHKYDDYRFLAASDSTLFGYAESKFFGPWPLGGNSVMASQKTYLNARGKTLPIINSESAMVSTYLDGTDPRLQTMVGATWAALMMRMEILNNVNYNIYYAFNGKGSGFGMVNSETGKPWYPYYAQLMVGKNLAVNDAVVSSDSSSGDVRTLAWIHGQTLNLLLICRVSETRTVYLNGLTGNANLSKIDNSVSWTTPRIQSSTIDTAQSLTLNGYTVALLQTPIESDIIVSAREPTQMPRGSDIIVDDAAAVFVGNWPATSATSGYYGTGYRYRWAGPGTNKATFSFNIPLAGSWEVFAWWTDGSNRASKAPYTINAVRISTVVVDQRVDGDKWNSLGVFTFNTGTASIVLSDAANGVVIADAVRLVYRG